MTSVATIRVEDIAAHAAFCRLDTIAGIDHDLRYATATPAMVVSTTPALFRICTS